ncbi:MAG TPA: FtsQ-type POTRA domain-containing protein [Gammaproteobacteria bacterium]|nr:FtsQ-type POTRA domain-containing protein [Gammaproteobacteria bacterium]
MKPRKRQARRKQQSRRFDWRPWLRPAAVTVLFLTVTASLAAAVAWALDPVNLPLRHVRVEGDFRHLDRAALEARLLPVTEGGFFGVDVAAVRRSVQDMAWVDRVSVRRVWPDRLVVQVQEQQPVARWGETAYLNPRGEVFVPKHLAAGLQLPRLAGPAGRGRQVLAAYRRMGDILAGLRLGIEELRQDERRAWHLRLSNGVAIELGRAEPQRRLARFVAVYPALLVSEQVGISAVDLRYSNGFAVRRVPPAPKKHTG